MPRGWPVYNERGAVQAIRDGDIATWPVISMGEATEHLPRHVGQVADGGSPIIIARYGHPLAVLVSYHQLQREALA
jgi:prevent-host-death family protein